MKPISIRSFGNMKKTTQSKVTGEQEVSRPENNRIFQI